MEVSLTPAQRVERLSCTDNGPPTADSVQTDKTESGKAAEATISEDLFLTEDKVPKQYLVELAAYAQIKQEANYTKHWIHLPSIATFRQLRQYNLEHIARELDKMSKKVFDLIEATPNDLDRLRLLLHEQVVAMQDLEYIYLHLQSNEKQDWESAEKLRNILMPTFKSHRYRGWTFGFQENTSAALRLKTILKRILPFSWTWTTEEREQYGVKEAKQVRHQLPEQDTMAVHTIASFIISICSGATIIVPMIIMSFQPGQTKSLVTTSVAVLLFGFVLSAVIKIKSSDIFLATATYAAVLVVFVGISGTASSGVGGSGSG